MITYYVVSNIPSLPAFPMLVSSPLNNSPSVPEESSEANSVDIIMNQTYKFKIQEKRAWQQSTDTAAKMLRQYIDMKKAANSNQKTDQLTKYFQSIENT